MAFSTQITWASTWLPLQFRDPVAARSCRWAARMIRIDEHLPVAYVTVPKAGSTTINTHFLARAGMTDHLNLKRLKVPAKGITAREVLEKSNRVQVYFTVVRHPVERLRSAYRGLRGILSKWR